MILTTSKDMSIVKSEDFDIQTQLSLDIVIDMCSLARLY